MFHRQEHSIVSLATRNRLQFDYQRHKKLLFCRGTATFVLVTQRQVSDVSAFSRSQTRVSFSDHLVTNVTQLYFYSYWHSIYVGGGGGGGGGGGIIGYEQKSMKQENKNILFEKVGG